MGYTTKFTGSIGLSRKLTLPEAQYLLEMQKDCEVTVARWGLRNYMQWVPTTALDAIVWDGEEKFYDYTALMRKLCEWLSSIGIAANGELHWRGEDSTDIGILTVSNNEVTEEKGRSPRARAGKPLTMEELGRLALAELAAARAEGA